MHLELSFTNGFFTPWVECNESYQAWKKTNLSALKKLHEVSRPALFSYLFTFFFLPTLLHCLPWLSSRFTTWLSQYRSGMMSIAALHWNQGLIDWIFKNLSDENLMKSTQLNHLTLILLLSKLKLNILNAKYC